MNMEGLLTPKDVSKYLKVATGFVVAHAEELGGIRLGGSEKRAGCWRFTMDGLRRYIAQGGSRGGYETPPQSQEPERVAG